MISYVLGAVNALWDWMESLGLAHDPCCFLHERADIAVKTAQECIQLLDGASRSHLNELQRRMSSSIKQVSIL